MAQDLRTYLDLVKRRKPGDFEIVSKPVDPRFEMTALVVKPARVGGPSATAEIAAAAADRGVPVIVSTLFETGIGIATALAIAADLPEGAGSGADGPIDHGLATAGLLEHDLLIASPVVEDGRMVVPAGMGAGGLGVVLDTRAVERFRIEAVGATR